MVPQSPHSGSASTLAMLATFYNSAWLGLIQPPSTMIRQPSLGWAKPKASWGKIWPKKHFGLKKFLIGKKFWTIKFFAQKKFQSENIIWPKKKFWSEIKFWFEKNFGQKKFLSKNFFTFQKFLVWKTKKYFWPEKSFGQKKNLAQKSFGLKKCLWFKKVFVKKNFGSNIFLVQKRF